MRFAVSTEYGVPVGMRDGTILRADVYSPRDPGPFPILVMRTPYGKTNAQAHRYEHPVWYAAQGFIVIIQDCRGRWASDGEWYPFVNEQHDGYDTIEWATQLPANNGRIGMYGGSYAGATQLLAAAARPTALSAICPSETAADYYDGWTYEGGALRLAFAMEWAMTLAQDTARRAGRSDLEFALAEGVSRRDASFRTLPLKEFQLLKEASVAPYFYDWLDHPVRDEYWQEISLEDKLTQVSVPVLHIGGWYDDYLDGTLKNYQGIVERKSSDIANSNQRLLVGPWVHSPMSEQAGDADFGSAARSGIIDDLQIRFFKSWLTDEDDGIRQELPVKLFVMGENVWRDEAAWPLGRAIDTAYYFHSDGRANSLSGDGRLNTTPPEGEPCDFFVYDPRDPLPSVGGSSFSSPRGSFDQRAVELDRRTLCYTTDILEGPLEVTGPLRVVLWAATTATDTDWVVRLVDVHPDGRAMNLAESVQRARFRTG